MLAKTHMVASLALSMPIAYYIGLEQQELVNFFIAVVLGALLPDLDEPNSYLSRKVMIVSLIISSFTKHRQLTHTLVFTVTLIGLLSFYILNEYPNYYYLLVGIGSGYLFHILEDSATKEGGIAFFYPFIETRFYILPEIMRFSTGGIVEKIVVIPFFTILMILGYYFFFWQAI